METAPSREGIACDVRISNTSKMKDFSVIFEGHSHVLELWEISWTELRFKYVICEGGNECPVHLKWEMLPSYQVT